VNFLEKITEKNIVELAEAAHYSGDSILVRRAQAILLLEEGASTNTMQLITGYKRTVIIKHRKAYVTQGLKALASKKKKKKSKALLTRNQKAYIVKTVQNQLPRDFGFESYPVWTTNVLGYLIKEQFGVEFKSKTSLYLIFKEAKFTFHKPDKVSEKRDQAVVDAWKKDVLPLIKAEYNKTDTLVFVEDEASLSSQTRVQRAWLPSDRSVEIQDTTKRKLAHLYGFLNIQSGDAIAYKTDKQTGSITVSVLKKLAKDFPNKRLVIVWDNASWHKSKEIREFLATTDRFKLYHLPPYSPDLNPQEHVWKDLRERIFNNKLIKDINVTINQAVEYIKNTIFKYAF
jgi:transposase